MLEDIKELLSSYVDDVDGITEDSKFVVDIGLSSLDFITFLGDVEEEFSLSRISEEQVPKLIKVGDLMDYIKAQKGE